MSTFLTIDSGDTETLELAVTDPSKDPPEVDLTGATLRFLVKRSAGDDDEDAVITKATGGSGITIAPGTGGTATIAIAPADTAGLEGRFVWGLQGTDTALRVTTLAAGTLTIRADIVEG